jgi:hypothetical protein
MCWIAKAAVKKKWSSGLQEEALLTDTMVMCQMVMHGGLALP